MLTLCNVYVYIEYGAVHVKIKLPKKTSCMH